MYSRKLITLFLACIIVSLGMTNNTTITSLEQSSDLHESCTVADSPNIQFSTYLGSTGWDMFREMTVDSNGDIYLVGQTESEDFPTTEDAFDRSHNGGTEWAPEDAFVMKLSDDGQEIIYSTFIGGSGDDGIYDIVVDEQGCAYVVGQTNSNDFPVVNAYDSSYNGGGDCFVAKLSPNGSQLEFSTFVGGSGNDCAFALDIDRCGNCVVVGRTASVDFPVLTTTNQSSCHSLGDDQDGFVFMLSDNGTVLDYSMYLGSTSNEESLGVSYDQDGDAVIVGTTGASDFPLVNPFDDTLDGEWDCFIVRVNASGNLDFSTYYGGTGIDYASEVVVVESGQIYVAGIMRGGEFPIVGVDNQELNGTWGVFLLIINSMEMEIEFSGVIRDSGEEESTTTVRELVVESENEIWIAGGTKYEGFPITNDAFDTSFENQEGYVTLIDPISCTLNFSSFFGGSGLDYCTGLGIVDSGDIICAGVTDSIDIPIHNAIEPDKISASDNDGFLFKLVSNATATTTTSSLTTSITSSPSQIPIDGTILVTAGIGAGLLILVVIVIILRTKSR